MPHNGLQSFGVKSPAARRIFKCFRNILRRLRAPKGTSEKLDNPWVMITMDGGMTVNFGRCAFNALLY